MLSFMTSSSLDTRDYGKPPHPGPLLREARVALRVKLEGQKSSQLNITSAHTHPLFAIALGVVCNVRERWCPNPIRVSTSTVGIVATADFPRRLHPMPSTPR